MNSNNISLVDRKIRIKYGVYIAVFVLTLILTVIHAVNSHLPFYFPPMGVVAGSVIGLVVSRMGKMVWDESGERIISKLDFLGLVILAAYIVFLIFKTTIIQHFVHFHDISAISLAVVAGVMLGRGLMMRKTIGNLIANR